MNMINCWWSNICQNITSLQCDVQNSTNHIKEETTSNTEQDNKNSNNWQAGQFQTSEAQQTKAKSKQERRREKEEGRRRGGGEEEEEEEEKKKKRRRRRN